MTEVANLTDWRGKSLFDRDGEQIGKLEDVYDHYEINYAPPATSSARRLGKR
jgi:PRC-barrel domain protein